MNFCLPSSCYYAANIKQSFLKNNAVCHFVKSISSTTLQILFSRLYPILIFTQHAVGIDRLHTVGLLLKIVLPNFRLPDQNP